ncbi:unnamed protein product, partial [Phaeothamnion confervicola]
QLVSYRSGTGIFQSAVVGSSLVSRDSKLAWWAEAAAAAAGGDLIATLAITLLRVVPHAAAPERLFSVLKWIQSDRRNRMSVQALSAIATIRCHLQRQGEPARSTTKGRVGKGAAPTADGVVSVASDSDSDTEAPAAEGDNGAAAAPPSPPALLGEEGGGGAAAAEGGDGDVVENEQDAEKLLNIFNTCVFVDDAGDDGEG